MSGQYRETDAVVQRAVRECMRGHGQRRRSLLVIAHRIETITDCSQLLVLSRGELAEAGPPRELMAKEGGILPSWLLLRVPAAATLLTLKHRLRCLSLLMVYHPTLNPKPKHC